MTDSGDEKDEDILTPQQLVGSLSLTFACPHPRTRAVGFEQIGQWWRDAERYEERVERLDDIHGVSVIVIGIRSVVDGTLREEEPVDLV